MWVCSGKPNDFAKSPEGGCTSSVCGCCSILHPSTLRSGPRTDIIPKHPVVAGADVYKRQVCSLRPDEDKLCFSAIFKLDANAQVLDQWFGRTVIRSNRRFTYEEAQERIEGAEGDYREEILLLNRLAQKLRQDRFKEMCIRDRCRTIPRFVLVMP